MKKIIIAIIALSLASCGLQIGVEYSEKGGISVGISNSGK